MNSRRILLPLAVLLSLVLVAACARQLTKAQSDRLGAIAAKIAEAERLGAGKPDCAPRELARAKVELAYATREMKENPETAEEAVRAAEKAADELLAKARECGKPKAAPAPAEAPAPAAAPPAAAAEPVKPEAPPPEPAEAPAISPTGAPVTPGKIGPSGFENIYFDFDKSFIREDAKPALADVAKHLKANPAAKIIIEGHCDERGTNEYNMALGQRRADSAKTYLVNLGIDAARLSTISYGEEKPAASEHDEESWAKNRRAVFVLR